MRQETDWNAIWEMPEYGEPAEIHLAVDGEEFLESGYFAEETSDTGTVQVSGFWVSMTSEEETGERKD